jgi:hypothetical protein
MIVAVFLQVVLYILVMKALLMFSNQGLEWGN